MPITGLDDLLIEKCTTAFNDATEATMQVARDTCPIGATSELLNSAVGPEPLTGAPDFTAHVGFEADQANYTNDGTAPHPIDGNPTLSFFWENAGVQFIGPHVNHPGQVGTHWFDDAVDQFDTLLQAEFV